MDSGPNINYDYDYGGSAAVKQYDEMQPLRMWHFNEIMELHCLDSVCPSEWKVEYHRLEVYCSLLIHVLTLCPRKSLLQDCGYNLTLTVQLNSK